MNAGSQYLKLTSGSTFEFLLVTLLSGCFAISIPTATQYLTNSRWRRFWPNGKKSAARPRLKTTRQHGRALSSWRPGARTRCTCTFGLLETDGTGGVSDLRGGRLGASYAYDGSGCYYDALRRLFVQRSVSECLQV